MKIFVTGATGYLGYHFVKVAITQGHKVLCLRRPTSVSLFEPIVEQQIQWVNNDDEAKLRETVNAFQPDVLFHAAWGGVRGAGREDAAIQQENLVMSRKLYRLYPYKQIIGLGSQGEYGFYEGLAYEDQPLNPLTLYGKAKAQTCEELRAYCEKLNIEWQWIRIFTVFGEKLTGGLIKLIAERCLAGDKEFDTTKGEQKYSYLYAVDYAKAICRVLGSHGKSGIYNLSQPADVHSNKEILTKVKDILDSDIQVNFGALPYEKNQVMYMDGCVTKFENAFGAIPHTDFDEALESTVESVKMTYMIKKKSELQKLANRIRGVALTLAHNANESHSGGALSMSDILAVLYSEYIDTDLVKIESPNRDRVILSKGHCCASFYAILAEVGIIDKEELMQNFAKNGTHYFAHVSHTLPGVELSTGSLGHGLPVACGMALGAKKSGLNFNVYCIVGDGEMNEGSNWEAIMFAAQHQLDNLCLIIDKNKMQALGDTKDILCLDPMPEKLAAFGWDVEDIDGNDIEDVISAFECFKNHRSGKPFVMVANTIKGKGVSFMEHNLKFHYSAPKDDELKQALEELA